MQAKARSPAPALSAGPLLPRARVGGLHLRPAGGLRGGEGAPMFHASRSTSVSKASTATSPSAAGSQKDRAAARAALNRMPGRPVAAPMNVRNFRPSPRAAHPVALPRVPAPDTVCRCPAPEPSVLLPAVMMHRAGGAAHCRFPAVFTTARMPVSHQETRKRRPADLGPRRFGDVVGGMLWADVLRPVSGDQVTYGARRMGGRHVRTARGARREALARLLLHGGEETAAVRRLP